MANAGGSQHAGTAVQAAVSKDARRAESTKSLVATTKTAGYGLPCSKCHLYYSADLDSCPTCHTRERVAPVAPKFPPRAAHRAVEAAPSSSAADQEREEFLKQFKVQAREAPANAEPTTGPACRFEERHPAEAAPAEVCGACYERLQDRVDAVESAMHIDLKEAAQNVYDAVWENPSEPSKTYEYAADALLKELRKRAGMAMAQTASE